MNLWLVSNIRLEPRTGLRASAIQNLRTATALAELGHGVLLWCDRIAPGAGDWLREELGRPLPPACRLFEAPARGGEGEKRSAVGRPWDRLRSIPRARRALGRPAAIISRSPSILRQFRASRLRPGGARLIHELQYPEWSFLWRDWAGRHPGSPLTAAVAELRRLKADEARGYRVCDGILYAARSHERLIRGAGYAGPARWIPSACEVPEAAPPESDAAYEVGYVGSLAPENGLEGLIEAVGSLAGVRLLLLGGGSSAYVAALRAKATSVGAADRITFAGRRPPAEVRTWMRQCRLGVVPLSARCGAEKRQYASPLKLVEWMAAGVPVAASSVPSVLQHEAAGDPLAIFPPDNPIALADCLAQLLADESALLKSARLGLVKARERAFPQRARLIIEFIESLKAAD